MRGFVAEAPATGQHTAVFIRPELTPISFEADKVHFHHAAASLKVSVPRFDLPVTVVSVHLCPNSPPARLREVSYLFNLADPASLTLIAGDFNSVSPDDPEPKGLDALSARFRMRYTGDDGRADRGTIASLLRAGFVDIGPRLEATPTATVPAAGYSDTEFVPFRSDYLLATPLLARAARAYGVVRSAAADVASDRYPVWADFQGDP